MKASDIFAADFPKGPGAARTARLRAAIDAGDMHVEYEWIKWVHDGHVVEVEVGLAPLAIGESDDWAWFPLTHPLAQHAADTLGAVVATAHICDRNAAASDIWVAPQVQSPGNDSRSTERMMRHHTACVDELDRMGYPLTQLPGKRITGVGKTHVTSRKVEPKAMQGKSCFTGFYSKDPTQRSTSVPGVRAIQGGRYYESTAHFLHFDNYPTGLTRLVKFLMRIDGVTWDIRYVMLDPTVSHLVTGYEKGSKLTLARHPAVPRQAARPRPVHVELPGITFGQRVASWYKEMQASGVREQPPGSNTGPEIAEWFKPCMRIRNGKETPIGITAGPWCVVTFCAALRAAMFDGQAPVFEHDRVSGFELERDARALGIFVPVSLVMDGSVQLEVGDGVLLRRGGATSWKRHMCIVAKVPNIGDDLDALAFRTLGGNEEDQIRLTDRRLDDEQLIGFIELPHAERERIRADSPEMVDHIADVKAAEDAAAREPLANQLDELTRKINEAHAALSDDDLARKAGFY